VIRLFVKGMANGAATPQARAEPRAWNVERRRPFARPVFVLNKADLCDDPGRFVEAARALQAGLRVELVDGRDPGSAARLAGL